MRSSLIVKKYNGEFVGKLAPYGYIKDQKDKHKFLIDKNVSKVIVKIFDMTLNGKSRKEIADYLNNHKILVPSQYLKINKEMSVLKKWNSEMVNKILRNLKCKLCDSNMIKRTSKGKVYYYCANYYRKKSCKNNKSISKSILEEFIKREINITEITRLNIDNNIKYIYIGKDKEIKVDYK